METVSQCRPNLLLAVSTMSFALTTIPPSDALKAKNKRHREFAVSLFLFGLFIVGLIGIFSATGWEEVQAQLAKLSVAQVSVLLCLSLVNYISRAIRWHILVTRIQLPLKLRTNLLHFIGGFALSITPGRVGELVRLRWQSRLTGWPFLRLTSLPLVDRALDMAAMGALLALGVALTSGGVTGATPVAALALIAAVVLTRPALLEAVIEGLWRIINRGPRIFVRLRQAARSMALFSPAHIIGPALALGFIGWFAEGVSLYMLLKWMGADIELSLAVVIFLFSTLAGGLTGAPGGIGGAEAAMVFLLHLNNVSMDVAVPATAVIRMTSLWFAIALGAVAFTIAEKQARKG